MRLIKGLLVITWIYAVGFAVYNIGYMNGAESESWMVKVANKRTKDCVELIVNK